MLRHYLFGILNTQRTHTCKYGHVASSTHSVSQVEAQKKVCEKIKSVVRGSERKPVAKLYKRPFRPLKDRIQRPIT